MRKPREVSLITHLPLLLDGVALPFESPHDAGEVKFRSVRPGWFTHHKDKLDRARRKFDRYVDPQPPIASHLPFGFHNLHRTLPCLEREQSVLDQSVARQPDWN